MYEIVEIKTYMEKKNKTKRRLIIGASILATIGLGYLAYKYYPNIFGKKDYPKFEIKNKRRYEIYKSK